MYVQTEIEESAKSYQTPSLSVWVRERDCLETTMATVYRHNCIKKITSDDIKIVTLHIRLLMLLEKSSKVDLFKVGYMM